MTELMKMISSICYIYILFYIVLYSLGTQKVQKARYFADFYWDFYYGLLGLLLRSIGTFITVDNFYWDFYYGFFVLLGLAIDYKSQ